MKRCVLRSPMCGVCGAPGKKKGGVKSESVKGLYYERFYVCSRPRCANALMPQSMRAFEGAARPFGERQ